MGLRSMVCAAIAAGALFTAGPAAADPSRAWAAAKQHLPAATRVVIGVDMTAVAKSALFTQLMPRALGESEELRLGFELLESTCKIDPRTAVHGAVIGTDAEQSHGAVFLALSGVDQQKLVDCLGAIARANGAKEVVATPKKLGPITEITFGPERAYVRWISSDVLALSLDVRDKAQLEQWTGQKGALARTAVGKLLGGVDTRAALWGASSVPKELEGIQMKRGYGSFKVGSGTLTSDLHVGLGSADAATEAVTKANEQLAQVLSSPLPPNIKSMLQSVKVTSAGADVSIRATVPEKDLLAVLSALL
ncbi:MAG: hypothetical protein ACTHU0_26290 [Kofleriaceae bacterium]